MSAFPGDAASTSRSNILKWREKLGRQFQYYLDKSTPHPAGRWLGSLVVAIIYSTRVYYLKGFYIVTYALGIYILNLLIGFLSPKQEPDGEGPALPSKNSDEFKPFIRRLPEFKFWYQFTRAFIIAFFLTFFSLFDVPVFWPILLVYWLVLFISSMKRQLAHMIKHRYIPFSFGKQKYRGKAKAPGSPPKPDKTGFRD
eukprot:TRINITY_DN4453_c0_g1_i2.p1 TRINITY_DN4453_c0_g1~~TRINITY_DN4453_c0_g1_i2.p1  ORF type:complete len:198 (-),score=19.96 TRINITY_DN4453_c0_g1_i2:490-1083(-)